eukprot:SAG22_NODE_8543_length_647_cov_0.808394_1_plen_102_part_00
MEESDNPIVNAFRSARHAMFGETEQGMALKEIARLHPGFDPYEYPVRLAGRIDRSMVDGWMDGWMDGHIQSIDMRAYACMSQHWLAPTWGRRMPMDRPGTR